MSKKATDFKKLWRQIKIYSIFVIAVFAFAIMGVMKDSSNLVSAGKAASVNGKVISFADYRKALQQMEEQMKGFLGNMNEEYKQQFMLNMRQRAMSQLISTELLVQLAHQEGIYATDKEIIDYIKDIPPFQKEGRFSRELYENYLTNTQTIAADFEDQIRKQIIITKVEDLFSKSVMKSNFEAQALKLAQETKAEIEFIRFIKEDLKTEVTSAEVTEFLAKNDTQVQDYYNKNKQEFSTEEQVKARHILARFETTNSESKTKARSKIEAALKRLENEDFAKVAQEISEDPGSQQNGGDLGYFTRGRMEKSFEDQAFSMKAGEVSPIIETAYGYHVIKLEDKKPAQSKSLAEVKNEIAKKLLAQQKSEENYKKLETLLAEGQGAGIKDSLAKWGLKWESTGEFNLSQAYAPKLGDEEKVVSAALNMKQGDLSKKVIVSNGKNYIISLKKLTVAPTDKVADVASLNGDGQSLISEWLKEEQPKAKIHMNERILSQAQ